LLGFFISANFKTTNMIKIGIDMMGGDFAPQATAKGVAMAQAELAADNHLVLIGNQDIIKAELQNAGADASKFTIVHAPDIIEMGEHPAKAFQQKPHSSISIGFHLLKENKIDVFASAGNTGAMLVGTLFSVKAIEGISRPCIASVAPKLNGSTGVILDVGANADVKPEHLNQFALLGSIYAEAVLKCNSPKVGLLNLGEEEGKGNLILQAAYPLLKENNKINFIGNIEGRDIFNDKADVIVCDGYVGNVVLKMGENIYDILIEQNAITPFFERVNYENYGGMPILGANAAVVIGHGVSNAKAIKNMILHSRDIAASGMVQLIKNAIA
jgi:glycerol-3-phosphate acyltransferase PlsX